MQPVGKEDLRQGLSVYQSGQPERPGAVLSWKLGPSPDSTTVTVGWLGDEPTVTPLSSLRNFGSFVADLLLQSERYTRLLAQLQGAGAAQAAASVPDRQRNCLTCEYKQRSMDGAPCETCQPVTGSAIHWSPAQRQGKAFS